MNWRFFRRGAFVGFCSALLGAGLLRAGAFTPFENAAYIQLFRLRGERAWSPQLAVIGIDDDSLAQIGQFPWSREVHAELLAQIAPAQPSAIVFDLVFADFSESDTAFAKAIAAQQKVVVAQAWAANGQPVVATPEILEAAIASGHVQHRADADGVSRTIKPKLASVPMLGFTALQVHSISQDAALQTRVAAYVGDDGSDEQLWINWPSAAEKVTHYAYADVLQGAVPIDAFTGKIVLVGATAAGVDSLSTPFDRYPPTSGVFLQAAVIDNALKQTFLKVPGRHFPIALLVLLGPALGVALSRRYYRTQIVMGVCMAAGWLVTAVALFHVGYWWPVVWPVGLIGLTVCSSVVTAYSWEREQLKRQLTKLESIFNSSLWWKSVPGVPQDDTDTTQRAFWSRSVASLLVMSERAAQLVQKDELTQVGNRRTFEQYFGEEWQRAAQSRDAVSVLMCDVDYFKKFNDTYGHIAGDACLREIAIAIQSALLRPNDFVARYGGEEFVVVLPNINADGAMHVAEKVCAAVSALNIEHKESQVSDYVTMSIGVATDVPSPGSLPQVLIAAADEALYQSKEMGRDRATLFYDTKRTPNLWS